MKTLTNYVKVLLITTSIITFTSCSKDDSTTPNNTGGGGDNGGKDPVEVEGNYVGTWLSPNEKLPTQKYRDNYKSFEIIFNDDKTYKWTFTPKTNSPGVFEGTITQDVTSYKHSSGSRIWQIGINVTKLNGQSVSGGWAGIYTYEDPKTLLLNVEPTANGWSKWPTADAGIGSGQVGDESVYTFLKQ